MRWTTPIVSAIVIVLVVATAISMYAFLPGHRETITVSGSSTFTQTVTTFVTVSESSSDSSALTTSSTTTLSSTSTSASTASTTVSSITTPTMINVFGLVSIIGQGTHAVAMTFTNIGTGANFTAPVSNGSFSIDLPNGAVYDVAALWAGNYSWQAGVEQRGELTVNMSAGSMAAQSYNVEFETPPTVVAINGKILWSLTYQGTSFSPVKIVYTASDGESFEAAVLNATFSTILPNMMNYQVKIFWEYPDGTTDYLFATNQTVNEGIGVVGLDLVIA